MISVFEPKFIDGQWQVEVVDVEDRAIYYKYFTDEKEARKFYEDAREKAKKKIILI